MKFNFLKLSALLLSFSLLTACSQSRFMDLGGFVYNFNRVSGEEITFEGVYIYNDEKDTVYEIFFGENKPEVVLKLIEDKGRIKQVRIAVAKINGKGEPVPISPEVVSTFISTAESTIRAWCNFEKEKAQALMNEFLLYENSTYSKQGELYKKEDKFSFVYYSDSFVCDLIISDTYLTEEENTEKPVSKPVYGNTTNIRGETEPLPSFKSAG